MTTRTIVMTEVSQPVTSADIGAVVNASARRTAGSYVVRAAIAAAIGLAPFVVGAAPVLPGAVGYGVSTPAGRGGTVYRVTNLAASGAGSLRACVDAVGPRVCVFEVSGTIRLTDDLHIRNPNI